MINVFLSHEKKIKLLIIISQQHDFPFSSSYQFGFKPHSSTVLCGALLIETIEHYVRDSRQPAYVLLLDVSKGFEGVL